MQIDGLSATPHNTNTMVDISMVTLAVDSSVTYATVSMDIDVTMVTSCDSVLRGNPSQS
jgi:hypothetical protein